MNGGGNRAERQARSAAAARIRLICLQAQSQQRAVDAARARAKAANDLPLSRPVASGAISAAEFDQINAAAEAARADLSAAQAQANVAQTPPAAGLLADADGVVVETLEPGQVVSAGQVVIRRRGRAARSAGATAGDAAPGGRQRGAGDTLWQRISAGHGDPAPAGRG